MTRRRKPSPWEAAQVFPPPRSWLRRTLLSARIRWAAARTRSRNELAPSRPARAGNQRPYGTGTSNG